MLKVELGTIRAGAIRAGIGGGFGVDVLHITGASGGRNGDGGADHASGRYEFAGISWRWCQERCDPEVKGELAAKTVVDNMVVAGAVYGWKTTGFDDGVLCAGVCDKRAVCVCARGRHGWYSRISACF